MYFNANDGTSGNELWAVDTGAPDTTLVEGPGARTADRTPSFSLSSSAVDLARYECSPSGAAGSFSQCGGLNGGVEFPRLDDGAFDLQLRAVDVRDNPDASPIVVPLTVDGTAPKVVLKGKLKPSGSKVVGAKVQCKRSEKSGPCIGKIKLKATKGPKGKLGSGTFRLQPGKSKRVKVKLTKRGRALFGVSGRRRQGEGEGQGPRRARQQRQDPRQGEAQALALHASAAWLGVARPRDPPGSSAALGGTGPASSPG